MRKMKKKALLSLTLALFGLSAGFGAMNVAMAKADETVHTVVSVITSGNAASERLHSKFGFTFSGTIKEVGMKFGKYLDISNYYLIV